MTAESRTRPRYTEEFKRGAVAGDQQGYTVAEAARSLDINSNMLGHWRMDRNRYIRTREEAMADCALCTIARSDCIRLWDA